MTVCFVITGEPQRLAVKSVDVSDPNDPARTGPLYDAYGETKGYEDGEGINPIRRADDAQGNPRYILVKSSILNDENLQTAAGYLVAQAAINGSGIVTLDNLDQNFPGVYTPPGG